MDDDVGPRAGEIVGVVDEVVAICSVAGIARGADVSGAVGGGVVPAVVERDGVAAIEELSDCEGAGELGAADDQDAHERES